MTTPSTHTRQGFGSVRSSCAYIGLYGQQKRQGITPLSSLAKETYAALFCSVPSSVGTLIVSKSSTLYTGLCCFFNAGLWFEGLIPRSFIREKNVPLLMPRYFNASWVVKLFLSSIVSTSFSIPLTCVMFKVYNTYVIDASLETYCTSRLNKRQVG